MYYARETVKKLKESRQIVIFGAGLVAREVAFCLMGEPYGLELECFLVSDREGNPAYISNLPVLDLKEGKARIGKDALIVVSVLEKYLDEVCEKLREYGFEHILPMTFESDRWSLIRGNAYRHFCLSRGKSHRTLEEELRSVCVPGEAEQEEGSPRSTPGLRACRAAAGEGDAEPAVRVYRAVCHVDRPLQEDLSRYRWEIPIQVGAALTKERICELRDNQGDNISHKNRQYCELTALYWIWKHDTSAYAGFCHYRRHFELNEKMLRQLAYSDIDVVLTIPVLNVPSVEAVYRHDHVGRDWEVMMEAVRILAPDYMASAQELQNGNFYYAYNMVIARKKILDDYCAWLFPILQYCEERCGEREGIYQERYLGFLAERLMGIYFLKHEDTYKIVHARKHFVKG